MKKFLLLLCLTAVTVMSQAAFVKNMPVKRLQPNGDTLNCYVTGDEYYHRMHDALGYTIVLNEQTGYYVYGVMQNGGANCEFGHFHFHVFPRLPDDGYDWVYPEGEKEVSAEVADKLRKAVS